jgi:hypothetical protein
MRLIIFCSYADSHSMQLGVRNVVYLVRARVDNAQQIAQQIIATRK